MAFQSNALWPAGVCFSMYGDNISTDEHGTEAQARAVCKGLERHGFGGMGEHFPICTWVSPVQQPPKLPEGYPMTQQTNALRDYDVTVLFDASASVTVKAVSPEEAAIKAEEMTSGYQSLCHQCSDTLETGDSIGALVYADGELVSDTSWQAQKIAELEAERDQLRAQLAESESERVEQARLLGMSAERELALREQVERLQGGEPVAWTVAGDVTNWARDFSKYRTQHYVRPVYTAQPAAPALVPWQPIETAPKDGRTILLGGINSCGNWRTMRGQWMSQDYIDQNWEDPEAGEPGWFETCVEADEVPNCWPIAPTRWMPLPPPPVGIGQPVGGEGV